MKFNLSNICRAANIMVGSMSRSQAFKTAWKMAKEGRVEKVVGVLFRGRQEAIHRLSRYPDKVIKFHLMREQGNCFDINAIAIAAEVIGRGRYKMGYLSTQTAAILAPLMDNGVLVKAGLKMIVGGFCEGINFGIRIQVAI